MPAVTLIFSRFSSGLLEWPLHRALWSAGGCVYVMPATAAVQQQKPQ